MNLRPASLLCGPDNEVVARYAVAEITAGSAAPLQVVIDSNLAAEWYVFASPQVRPAFVHGFKGDEDGPVIVPQRGFAVDGWSWRVALRVAFADFEPRAAVMNPGV